MEIRDRPYDLYAIMALSTMLLAVLLFLPGITPLRVVLGLPFILFFPGYALICALYPERPRIVDADIEKGSKGEIIPAMTKAGKRQMRRDRREAHKEEEENGDDLEKTRTKGIDTLERVALSLGLSIAISPLIGLVLNYTYDWNPDHLGIRLTTVFAGLYAFIMITSIIAVRRRMSVPMEDRYGFIIDISFPEGESKVDRALTVGIVVMMLLSAGLLIYIIVVPRTGESFTEFYVLGRDGKADEYPRYFETAERMRVTIGIGNHEHRDMNYTLTLTISPQANNLTVEGLDNVTISRTMQPSMEIQVQKGGTLLIPCNFSIGDPGSYKLRFLLYLDGKEYRDLHLWVRAFYPGTLRDDGHALLFVAGEGGDPAHTGAVQDGRTTVGLGMMDRGGGADLANVTFSTGGQSTFREVLNMTGRIDDHGAFAIVPVGSGSVAESEIELHLPDTATVLLVSIDIEGREYTFTIGLRGDAL